LDGRVKSQVVRVIIVGAGRLAQALARSLNESTAAKVVGVASTQATAESRSRAQVLARRLRAKAVAPGGSMPEADCLWICVADGEIQRVAASLAQLNLPRGIVALHSSGSLTSDALAVLREAGAAAGSAHPMMTFVGGKQERMRSVPFGVEGDRRALSMARKLIHAMGGEAFTLRKEQKRLYHLVGYLSSPALVTVLEQATEAGVAAGLRPAQVRQLVSVIVRTTVENFLQRGGAKSFSGPVVRGDEATIKAHLHAMDEAGIDVDLYGALIRAALQLLPSRDPEAIKRSLSSR
jgi:predicted short-subunit dehydrogenase-like oxidoreductase (DUF2520 family)